MKAAVYHQYGSPEVVVHIEDVETPVPEDDDVLIRVHAAAALPSPEELPVMKMVLRDPLVMTSSSIHG